MKISGISTPALILDVNILKENAEKMKTLLEGSNLKLRPHYKSHKCPAIAHRQIGSGAKGITCAKLSEAEDLILSGVEDVLIANQIVEISKIQRAGYLAGCCKLTVCVDSKENAMALEQAAAACGNTVYCLIEYEMGMNRCGLKDWDAIRELAETILAQPHLQFEGIQAYAGQLSHEEDDRVRAEQSRVTEEDLAGLVRYLKEQGIPVKEVSGESTGTVELRPENTVYTEIQAGTYLFMDAAYERVGVGFEHSLFMVATVISTAEDKFVCDAGMKSLGVDQGGPVFPDYPDAKIEMSEEHCAAYCKHTLSVGDKVLLIPGHCCTTMNLQDRVFMVKDGQVIDRIRVESRGKSL